MSGAGAPVDENKSNGAPTSGYGMVKSVLSGDQLVLVGKARVGEVAPEKRIILSDILAPRLARGRDKDDEPWAWHAREFLRRKVIGQQVTFLIVQQTDGREYGMVRLGQEDLAQALVAAGWAEVKLPPVLQKSVDEQLKADPNTQVVFPSNIPAHLFTLWDLQRRAKGAGIGRWTKLAADADLAPFVRSINFRPDAMDLFDKCRNVPLPAQVEKVLDGHRIRCLVTVPLPGQQVRQQHALAIPPQTSFVLNLAGLQCPEMPMPVPGGKKPKKDKLPAFAEAAVDYVSRLLLDRPVHVVLQAVDKRNQLYGSLQFPRGNITLKLLEQGLARLVPWSAMLTGFENAKAMDLAQQQAVMSRVGVWSLEKVQARLTSGIKYNGSESVAAANAADPNAWRAFQLAPPRHGEVLVVEIRSGDRLVVQDLTRVFVGPAEVDGKPGASDRFEVSLASVRAPRIGRQGAELVQDLAPFAWQARDWLRRRLIGQKVRAVLEYCGSGSARDVNDARLHVSLYDLSNNFNFGMGLVAEGLVTVTNHSSYEPRAAQYLNLLQSELLARSEKKALHSLPEEVKEKEAEKPAAAAAAATSDGKKEGKEGKKAGKPEPAAEKKPVAAASSAAAQPKKALPGQVRITDLTLQVGGRPKRGGKKPAGKKDGSKDSSEDKETGSTTGGMTSAALQSELHHKIQQLGGQLRGDKRHPAMVERVFSSTRFKVFFYKQNTFATVLLAGVRGAQTPAAGKAAATPSEQAGELGLTLTRDMLTQRDVRIQIVDIDHYDNLYAVLYLDQTNWGEKLVSEGLATVIPPSAARLQCGAELVAAQKKAQKLQLNLWTGYDEEAERAKKIAEQQARESPQSGPVNPNGALVVSSARIPVTITEIVDAVHFFVRVQDEEAQADKIKAQIDEWLAENADEAASSSGDKKWKPERNDVCLGVFSADEQWYRVKIDNVVTKEGEKEFQVLFLDYGGYDVLPLEKLRPLDAKLQKLPATTHLCALTGVKGPSRISGLLQDAAQQFNTLTLNQSTTAVVDLITPKLVHLSLFVDAEEEEKALEEEKSVQASLLEQGWLRVLGRPDRALKDLSKELRAFENVAKHRRLGLWKVGDVSSSDEEDLAAGDLVSPPEPASTATQQ